MKIKIATAVLLAAYSAFGQYSGGGGVTTAQLATKLSLTNITQTVTSGTNTVPSNKAVEDALALKAGTTNAVLSWTAISNETTYVYTEFYDATNNVKRFTRNP
jgi:hypothetical protein